MWRRNALLRLLDVLRVGGGVCLLHVCVNPIAKPGFFIAPGDERQPFIISIVKRNGPFKERMQACVTKPANRHCDCLSPAAWLTTSLVIAFFVTMNQVRFGIVGLGNMGVYHANYFDSVENATLAGICDIDAKKLDNASGRFPKAKPFSTYQEMYSSGMIDAVLVATPHYQHAEMTLAAFDKNLHVLCEKPEAVTVKEARRMNEGAAKHPELKFGIDFQMRPAPS